MNPEHMVQVRVPDGIIKQIDDQIKAGEFKSRSEFFKRVAVIYLSNTPEKLLQCLQNKEVQTEICQIVSNGLNGRT